MSDDPPPRRPGDWTPEKRSDAVDGAALPLLPLAALGGTILLYGVIHFLTVTGARAWFSP